VKKLLIIVPMVLFLVVFCISVKVFLIGEPVDGDQLWVETTEDGDSLQLTASVYGSAIALKGWKFRQEDGILYIRAGKVLVSPLFRNGTYQTTIETALLDEIYLGGRLIWQKGT